MGLLRNLFSASAASPEDPGDDDALLVSQARQGDAQAVALLFQLYLIDSMTSARPTGS